MSNSQRASRSPGSAGESGAHPPSLPTRVPRQHASPSMIGPPPSFYDPNQAIVPEGPDYQQWIMENYGATIGGGQHYAQGGGGPMSGNVPFQQQAQSQLHHVAIPPPPPPQNQYNFVQQEPYGADPGTSYDSHLVQTAAAADRPQRGLPATRISRRGGAAVNYSAAPQLRVPAAPSGTYQQSQPSPSHGGQSFGPGTESYFYGGDQQPQPQQQQQQQHSSYNFVGYQPEQYASASSYTPSSEFTNLPSSVSTPSVGGTDDGHAHAYPMASQHASQHPQASSSRQPSASAARGRGRGGKAAKRARVEDSLDGGDSDTQSDDDGPFGATGFTTVSVPPPQGQSSLPARL
ncbi:hypothetical protein L227DRAFT_346448 [Lentinus tigrinus ALCF2SS1-6]|uniref:Uncharacterized protein n=1 Tax=Lentinus tigrinus ALCF2SS1-6 TaxID=1328759 RepID=A0A5C2RTC3_9APHY|nr:hypothetical protein L227DRAFT_346448 [Lentinus tigrinus ALCF2SS1-6]